MTGWIDLKDLAAEAEIDPTSEADRWCLMELACLPNVVLRREPEPHLRLVVNG